MSISPFLIISSFWVRSTIAAKMAAILGDVTGPQQRRKPIIYTSPCRANHKLSTKRKILSKSCNISKTQWGDQPPSPPHPCLYHGLGVTLFLRPRVYSKPGTTLPRLTDGVTVALGLPYLLVTPYAIASTISNYCLVFSFVFTFS